MSRMRGGGPGLWGHILMSVIHRFFYIPSLILTLDIFIFTDDGTRPKPKKKNFIGRKIVHQIPLDSLGRPIFPIELGHLTVYCLGEVCMLHILNMQ
jgi:hypothetical protein